MYNADVLLKKLNAPAIDNGFPTINLADVMTCSFAEFSKNTGNILSWSEKNFLFKKASEEHKKNRLIESRVLARANPQLRNAIRLGLRQQAETYSYNDLFGNRANRFVNPGSVASMFSPAAYLTELYREAQDLHPGDSKYHLTTRRPDLGGMVLSQRNMDEELSTLSLSNELLLGVIKNQQETDYDGVMEMFSTYRKTGATPYNLPYEATRQAILLQDPEFIAFRDNPSVAAKMDTASLLGIQSNIPPELHRILTEEITEETADALLLTNFGDINISPFQSPAYLAKYYDLTNDELNLLVTLLKPDADDISVEYYRNDYLIAETVDEYGEIKPIKIVRTRGSDYDKNLNYCELIPVGGDKYKFTINAKVTDNIHRLYRIGTEGTTSSNIFASDDFSPEKYVTYSYDVTATSEQLEMGLKFNIRQMQSGGAGYNEDVTFTLSSYNFNVYLLKINKFIRLYKATGIAPNNILAVIESNNADLDINAEVLSQLFWVNYFMQRYDIDASAALVLSGTFITQAASVSQSGAFNHLFNSPPLNNQTFSADNTEIKLKPSEIIDTFRTGVLKRAFRVNDTELYSLWSLATGETSPVDFTCNMNNLSMLYRVSLLADIHGLSITGLTVLLSLSPYASIGIGSLAGTDLNALVNFVENNTRFLSQKNWTVGDLYLMTTGRYSTTMSPDIENLVATLKNGLSDSTTVSLGTIAPLFAAATKLDSAEKALAILNWLDGLKPGGLNTEAFLVEVASYSKGENIPLVSFCQVLAQLALIVNNLGLSVAELTAAVAQPELFGATDSVLAHDITTVRSLSGFHLWLLNCGASATEVLSLFSEGALTPAHLAQAMSLDELLVTQALAQVDSGATVFGSWQAIDSTLQWVAVASTLHITPDTLAALINIRYGDPAEPTYSDWVDLSHSLQAGLNPRQTRLLQAILDEDISAVASAWYLSNIGTGNISSRDQLYAWLLIDNQVCAQVKTTRLAEAIASIQLYINRALSSIEPEASSEVKSRQFFTDWDRYNKRYATWAGVSQLAYYPENYVDPTLRLGQTGMMGEMLQTLSQSQLTNDSVEGAFNTYMTRFEEIANLEIISGYHDNVDIFSGLTYLVGKSAAGDYYWRSANIGELNDGKLPANAWREWTKIIAPVTPFSDLIRPVIFQSRLYLVWVESRQITTVGKDNEKQETTSFLLKHAHILHDGTWSNPETISLPDHALGEIAKISTIGMYCYLNMDTEGLGVILYNKQDNYSYNDNDKFSALSGVLISSLGNVTLLKQGDSPLDSIISTVYTQLDTTTVVKLNTLYHTSEVHSSPPARETYHWGDFNFTMVWNSSVQNLSASIGESGVSIAFDAVARIISYGNEVATPRTLSTLMKFAGEKGDTFYVPTKRDAVGPISNDIELILAKGSEENLYKLYMFTESTVDDLYCISWDSSGIRGYALQSVGPNVYSIPVELTIANNVITIEKKDNTGAVVFESFKMIDTTLDHSQISLSVTVGGENLVLNSSSETLSHPDTTTKFTLDESLFSFTRQSVVIPELAFINNKADVTFTFQAVAPAGDDRALGDESYSVTLTRITTVPIITLNHTAENAQYLQYGPYRVRVNTLFAKQLVAYANMGIDNVLNMSTQELQEPVLGEGVYINLELSRYDASVNGTSGSFEILMCDVYQNGDRFSLASGTLDKTSSVSLTFFLPRIAEAFGNPDHLYICANYQKGETAKVMITKNSAGEWYLDETYIHPTFDGMQNLLVLNKTSEPMDFSGANALYFWEMFYYLPMMVFHRHLQEQRFDEATRWIKYVWNPDGYMISGSVAPYKWNVRPLEDNTSWHADPLDSVDPDAVAQADPMHYKVATFMAYLDLLLARGDLAYRQLQRDTLSEAKMWYTQALALLGDEPYLGGNEGWTNPQLDIAASQTTQSLKNVSLLALRQLVTPPQVHSANSLVALFLPQQNEKLNGYWQTLAQRMYNLRHNLSINGEPLALPVYAPAAEPAALLSAAVNDSQGGGDLPIATMPLYRFPIILEDARSMVNQLIQFGSTLLSITERQDAEALSILLQTQGAELFQQSLAQQQNNLDGIDSDRAALQESRNGAQLRFDSYSALYDANVNSEESRAINLSLAASVQMDVSTGLHTAAAALDLVPNIFGLADGGSRWGSIATAMALGVQIGADATRTAADFITQSEIYRRRREEWGIQRDAAQTDLKQIDAQLASLALRREGAILQKTYLETQQSQMLEQQTFLQNKFSNKALYNWLRGKLAAIYYTFYDLAVSRCLMAEQAYRWDYYDDRTASFIRPGAWLGTYAGLLAGETLLLNLAQMEQSALMLDQRAKEVTRTVCLSEIYAGLAGADKFIFADQLTELLNAGKGSAGADDNGLSVEGTQLRATLNLFDLAIASDYPASLGGIKRIKQIGVTLPALAGPYQDVRAVLSYGGSVQVPAGCNAMAISHGMNDSGQFQLDFNDSRYLPFEGIPVDDTGTLVLSFPDADGKQKDLLLSLSDIILHIHYTILLEKS